MKRLKYVGVSDKKPRVTLSFVCQADMANELIKRARTLELSLSQYIRSLLKESLLEDKNER